MSMKKILMILLAMIGIILISGCVNETGPSTNYTTGPLEENQYKAKIALLFIDAEKINANYADLIERADENKSGKEFFITLCEDLEPIYNDSVKLYEEARTINPPSNYTTVNNHFLNYAYYSVEEKNEFLTYCKNDKSALSNLNLISGAMNTAKSLEEYSEAKNEYIRLQENMTSNQTILDKNTTNDYVDCLNLLKNMLEQADAFDKGAESYTNSYSEWTKISNESIEYINKNYRISNELKVKVNGRYKEYESNYTKLKSDLLALNATISDENILECNGINTTKIEQLRSLMNFYYANMELTHIQVNMTTDSINEGIPLVIIVNYN